MIQIYCNVCGKHLKGFEELQEVATIAFTGGYGSVFGDGQDIMIHSCQDCLLEWSKTFKIKPYILPEEEDEQRRNFVSA